MAAGISVAVAYPVYKYLENRLMDEIFEFIDYFKSEKVLEQQKERTKEGNLLLIF